MKECVKLFRYKAIVLRNIKRLQANPADLEIESFLNYVPPADEVRLVRTLTF